MLLKRLIDQYRERLPRMKHLNQIPNSPLLRILAWVILQSYMKSPAKYHEGGGVDTELNGLVYREKLPGNGILYAHGTTAVIGFRGLKVWKKHAFEDCMSILNSDFPPDPDLLFQCQQIQEEYPMLYLTGHSFGGARANWLARTLNSHPHGILFNPAQGLDPTYESRFDRYPNITTYHIVGDMVSTLAGLEHPEGIHRINGSTIGNCHTLKNFLGN